MAGEGDGCAATKVWAAVIVIGVSVQYGLAGVCGWSAETVEAASGGGDGRSWWRMKKNMRLHRCGVECGWVECSNSVKATKMVKIEKMNNVVSPHGAMSAVSAFQRNGMTVKSCEISVDKTQRDARNNNEIGGRRKARIVGIVVMGKKFAVVDL